MYVEHSESAHSDPMSSVQLSSHQLNNLVNLLVQHLEVCLQHSTKNKCTPGGMPTTQHKEQMYTCRYAYNTAQRTNVHLEVCLQHSTKHKCTPVGMPTTQHKEQMYTCRYAYNTAQRTNVHLEVSLQHSTKNKCTPVGMPTTQHKEQMYTCRYAYNTAQSTNVQSCSKITRKKAVLSGKSTIPLRKNSNNQKWVKCNLHHFKLQNLKALLLVVMLCTWVFRG